MKNMKLQHILTFALIFICTLTANSEPRTIADIPNVHLSNRTLYVSNPDNILSPQAESQLNSILGDIWAKTSSEAVVVVVDEIEGDPDTFATELFQDWGIGKKDNSNGLLYLVSRKDRKTVIRTGYGMEGVIPDVIAGRIIRNIANPNYAQGDFDTGTLNAVQELSRIITTPGATEELMSKYKNDQGVGFMSGPDAGEILDMWLKLGTKNAVRTLSRTEIDGNTRSYGFVAWARHTAARIPYSACSATAFANKTAQMPQLHTQNEAARRKSRQCLPDPGTRHRRTT